MSRSITITRSDHPQYKTWVKCLTSHGRHKVGRFLVESRKLVAEALAGDLVETIVLREGADEAWRVTREMATARRNDAFQAAGAITFDSLDVATLPAPLFDALTTAQTPDGILAVATLPTRHAEPEVLSGRVLILDHLQDPGNVGTLLRSAEAFGFSSVLGFDSADFYAPKTLRSAMGSTFRLALYTARASQMENWHEEMGLSWWGADLGGTDVRTVTWPARFALVVGNEGRGISPQMQTLLDTRVTIPMHQTESLNAAVSGSLLMGLVALERPMLNR